MKKIISFFLAFTLLFALSSCSLMQKANDSKETANPSEGSEYHIHEYSQATCTEPGKCVCGATTGEPLGHEYTEATCTTPGICTRCNIKISEALGHSWKEATCEIPKMCLRCSTTEGVASGHSYNSNHICTKCNQTDPLYEPVKLSSLESYMTSQDYHGHFSTRDSGTDIFGVNHNDLICVSGGFSSSTGKAMETYRIDQKYDRMTGTIILCESEKDNQYSGTVIIYGDGKILYEKKNIEAGFEPVDFDIDISNVKDLSVYISDPSFYGSSGARCLSEVTLYPKQ